MTYTTHDVAVRGGSLRVGAWRGDGPVTRVVLALHGITSSHLAWTLVADDLEDGTLLLAPDLRGRARSAALPPPYGMAAHAADCRAVLDALAGGRCDVAAGHSMGGYVAVLLAATQPAAVGELLLVDGGVPLVLPGGTTLRAARETGLGPAAARLRMTFPDRAAYRAFWQDHPAFADELPPAIAAYVDYDLEPGGPPWRSSSVPEAMADDHAEQFVGGPVDTAWPRVQAPSTFLRAPRGLFDEPPGLFAPQRLDDWQAQHLRFGWHEVPDANHYSIVLGAPGARAVATALNRAAVSKAG